MQASETAKPHSRPLRSAALVLYGTLAILWLAIPQSVSTWSRDYLPASVQPVAAPVTASLESIANVTRLPSLYAAARERFQTALRK